MEDWARAGYPNAATARYKERLRREKAEEAETRRRKGELAARAARLNQSGAEAASTIFVVPASLDDQRR
jgi:hypothetical protein